KIFPGTVRDCWIYVPAQYDAANPACVLVIQDGKAHWQPERRWHIPTILDNLIHQQAIPVMIGIFIDPGVIPAPLAGGASRVNRSFEYDSRGDGYARFLLEEVLPEVGRRYNLASEANSRAIMGGSSGAMCAFNAAWERPDAFSRVLSIVGSYTAMRGGHTMAQLVRLTEPKPLRVFLESGADDFKIYAGDWYAGNQDMLSALTYAGYEVNHVWAEHAGHNDYHGSSIFPAALRWLWQGYPAPVKSGRSSQPVMTVLIPGETWQPVAGDYPSATALATSAAGDIFFASPENECIYRLASDGAPQPWARKVAQVSAMTFGPDGALYASQPGKRRIVKFEPDGRMTVWIKGIDAGGLSFTAKGSAFVSDPAQSKLWLLTPDKAWRVVDDTIASPWAVQLFGGGAQLIVSDAHGPASWLFTVQPDGTLADRAPYFRPVMLGDEINPGVTAIAVSPKGWPAFATTAGVQLGLKNGGLITGLIPPPGAEAGRVVLNAPGFEGLTFGGAGFDHLYASDGRRLYCRKIQLPDELWG
ncbi:MAG: alpha/beta hydrolase-fold protein, partial [Opitutaceae bacterium]